MVAATLAACLFASCYQPTEGCLNIAATNYDVSADDPCADCCKYPQLNLAFLHQLALPTEPDTLYFFKYNTPYPSPFDTNHYFTVQRCRYFVSNLKLIRTDGTEVGVTDSIWLERQSGDSIQVENNFTKVDRDILQAAVLGKVLAAGSFDKVRFTIGLTPELLDLNIDSIPTGHPLNIDNDTLLYQDGIGFVPLVLQFSKDTLSGTLPIQFNFLQARDIVLDLPKTFEAESGFNLRLTLVVDYMRLFDQIDFENGDPTAWKAKIDGQIANSFSVGSVKLE